MKDIVIRGSGGLAREVAYLIERINDIKPTWNLLGYIYEDIGNQKYGYKVIGNDQWFEAHRNMSCVIAIGDPRIRYKVYNEIKRYNLEFPNIIDPKAELAKDVKLGIGNIITGPARLSVTTQLGHFCLLNGLCSIGHDSALDDFISVNRGQISGNVSIGKRTFVGIGAKILPKVKIGQDVTIGAGSLVVKNVKDKYSVFGIPAKKLTVNNDDLGD